MLLPILFGFAALLGLAAFVAYSLQQPRVPKPSPLEAPEAAEAPRLTPALLWARLRRLRKGAEKPPKSQSARRDHGPVSTSRHTDARTQANGAMSGLNAETAPSSEPCAGTPTNRVLAVGSEVETLSGRVWESEQTPDRMHGHSLMDERVVAAARLPRIRTLKLEQMEIAEASREALQTETAVGHKAEANLLEASERMRTVADDLLASSANRLEQQANETADRLSRDIRDLQARIIDETHQQLAAMSDGEVHNRLARVVEQAQDACQRADAAVNTLHAVEQKAEANLLEASERMRAVVDDLLKASASRFEQQVNEIAERFSRDLCALQTRLIEEPNQPPTPRPEVEVASRMVQMVAQAQDASQGGDAAANEIAPSVDAAVNTLHAAGQTAEANLLEVAEATRKAANDLLESSVNRLEQQANLTAERLSRELQALQTRLIKETHEQLAASSQASLESLTKRAATIVEQCRGQLGEALDHRVLGEVRQLEVKLAQLLEKERESLGGRVDRRSTGAEDFSWEPVPTRRAVDWNTVLKLGAWAVPIVLALFIFLSVRPVMRLRPDPPVEFFEQRPDWSVKRRATEEHLARAYWESAVRYLQPKYEFEARLPDDPPDEFKAEGTAPQVGSSKGDLEPRSRYWRKLRQVWVLPQAWEKSYVWSTDWFGALFTSSQSAGKRAVKSTP